MRYVAIVTSIAVALGCSHRQPNGNETQPAPQPVVPPAQTRTTVRTDEPARSDARTLDQILAGRLSGVNVTPAPGGGIVVRFTSAVSFYGGLQPLFIVDGAPVEVQGGTLSWLNPRDVESITALKGADAAIYGVRGANGVIVIKTKGSH